MGNVARLSLWTVLLLALAAPMPVTAQGLEEIVVTARRREARGYDDNVPIIGLRRVADYAVQEVSVTGDTRDPDKRHKEIFDMIKGAIELAAKRGDIELATGEMIVEPLNAENFGNLTLTTDKRPDTDKTTFLVKTKLAAGKDAKGALEKIYKFIKDVPTVGRALMEPEGQLTLSVVRPDQYRGAIIDLVAADAHATAAKMGADYAIEAKGLERPVEWSRASLTEVFLYVPYSYDVVPKR